MVSQDLTVAITDDDDDEKHGDRAISPVGRQINCVIELKIIIEKTKFILKISKNFPILKLSSMYQ